MLPFVTAAALVCLAAPAELKTQALDNVYRVAPGVYSGSSPESEESLAYLERLGIKTVISVDGAAPDAEALEAIGARAVHVPLKYTGIGPIDRLTLTKAIRDLPRPIFVHCQHGKHRGPTAVCVALVGTGELDAKEAAAFQVEAGTSPEYRGLYEAVERATRVDDEILDSFAAVFEAKRSISSLREAMSEIDAGWYALDAIRRSGWATPEDHPDLVPASEAGAVHEALRQMAELEDTASRDERYRALVEAATNAALDLERSIVAGDNAASTEAFERLSDSCMQCHAGYRG